MSRLRVVVLTGLSGSGKSTAARALEDQGFFVVDNLPLPLFPRLLELVGEEELGYKGVALVTDVRHFDFPKGYEETLSAVKKSGFLPQVYFFDATDEILIRRFSETRRRHPMESQGGVRGGIERERALLLPLKATAAEVIDTTALSPHQLKAAILKSVLDQQSIRAMSVRIQSFGFRYGLPPESDNVFDVRFLPNPYFDENLRALTGLDLQVQDYVLSTESCRSFRLHLEQFLKFALPQYRLEGKSNLTISIGCTGGCHRSVSIVEALRRSLEYLDFSLDFHHRDLDKGLK